jgi:hypothetical protein
MRRAIVLLAVLGGLAGCDLAEEDFRPQLVVEGVLVAGESLPLIRLSQTAPLGSAYSFEAFAVAGAVVEVSLLAGEGASGRTYPYEESESHPGVYFPVQSGVVVPRARYRLTVRVPDALGLVPAGAVVRAETTVPDTFRVVEPPPDTVRYNPFGPVPELRVSPSAFPGRQAVYVFSIRALEPATYGLTPTYAALLDPDEAERVVEGTSPLLNEQNYGRNPDGTLTLQIPWLAIAYFGPNELTASALDDALFDYLRSRSTQFAPRTLSPGEIPEVLSNVENGVGVFGSAAQQTVRIFFRRP